MQTLCLDEWLLPAGVALVILFVVMLFRAGMYLNFSFSRASNVCVCYCY